MGASVHVVLEANWLLANGMNGAVWDLKVFIGGCWVEQWFPNFVECRTPDI